MTLRELEDALFALYREAKTYETRARYVALPHYTVRLSREYVPGSDQVVGQLTVDHDARTIWIRS